GAPDHLHDHRADDSARRRRQPAGRPALGANRGRAHLREHSRQLPRIAHRLSRPGADSRGDPRRARAPENGARRLERGVPARRWIGSLSGAHGHLRPAPRRRGRKNRHDLEAAGRTLMDVTDVLRDRRGEPDGLQKMLVASVVAHIAVAALVTVAAHWGGATTEPPRTIMTISIAGGGAGPVNGGMTSIGGRPIQQQTPPEEPPKREAVRPPAVKEP